VEPSEQEALLSMEKNLPSVTTIPAKLSCTPVPCASTAQGPGTSFSVVETHLKLEQGFSTKPKVQSLCHTTLQVTHNLQ